MTTTSPLTPAYKPTRPRSEGRSGTSTYSALLAQVKENGLLERRRGFYFALFGSLVGALGLAWVAFAFLGDSWFQLVVAGVLGVVFTQFAFLSHEAAHRQVFASHAWNDRAGRYVGTFLVGISYSWWMNKHTRHHGNPNTVGKDPDIRPDTLRFTPEDAAAARGPVRWLIRVQGYAFFPPLTLEGVNLHWLAAKSIATGRDTKAASRDRWLEAALLSLRFALYLTAVFWFLPFGMACAFLGVQLAVFGVMMGASFAPNHKGMPTIAHDARVDFFSRQVLTSRNIRGGWWVSFLMGGLNHQVEHHLFPSMPRANLRRAQPIVREHCARTGVPYTETGLGEALAAVVRHLDRVGIGARDEAQCPLAAQLRSAR